MKSMTVVLNGPVKGWDRSGQNGRFHYDTKKNTEIKAAIRYASQATAEELGIRLPIPAGKKGYAITLRCIFVPPKSYSKKRLIDIKLGNENPKCKPDIDNVSQLWLDALVSGGIIEDDKNVTELTVSKAYGESEKVSCTIYYEAEAEEAVDGQ